ncbi:hypothetical protein BRX37_15855 [Sphingomonas sp. S-NIH.Pt3_0716]|nr:hypothetical protein BRX37_15855 [Sphingomonas sp. S-NIH.Pt3_0716]
MNGVWRPQLVANLPIVTGVILTKVRIHFALRQIGSAEWIPDQVRDDGYAKVSFWEKPWSKWRALFLGGSHQGFMAGDGGRPAAKGQRRGLEIAKVRLIYIRLRAGTGCGSADFRSWRPGGSCGQRKRGCAAAAPP